jgi:hypothetical protein
MGSWEKRIEICERMSGEGFFDLGGEFEGEGVEALG